MTADEAWLGAMREKFRARLHDEREAFVLLRTQESRQDIIERAHKLAGIAGMLGAPHVGELALLLEETARTPQDYSAEIDALIVAIEQAIGPAC
jgi:HPt (histidine-containing phosphotransfer) domain-containing protein